MAIHSVDILPFLNPVAVLPSAGRRIRPGRLDNEGGLTIYAPCHFDSERGWCRLGTREPVINGYAFTHWYDARLHNLIRFRAWISSLRRECQTAKNDTDVLENVETVRIRDV